MRPSAQQTDRSPGASAVVFLSPHYDDAVLSCGAAIAAIPESLVITVFSGGPAPGDPISGWDRDCGFAPGDGVATIREQEDRAALVLLGSHGSGLAFMPAQYRIAASSRVTRLMALARRRSRTVGDSDLQREVTAKLAAALRTIAPDTCVIPLGVSHPDHVLTAASGLSLVDIFPDCRWLAYTDLPYGAEDTDAFEQATRRVRAAGCRLEPTALTEHGEPQLKRRAVDCYASQVRGLGDRVAIALASPESYFELSRPEPQPIA